MTVPSGPPVGDVGVRDLLSSLNALQVLSMVMLDASDEDEILDLAVSAVPSLGRGCRALGVWLDGTWRVVDSARGQVGCPTGLEDLLAPLGAAGGPVGRPGPSWAWAFPLTSRGGAFGHLIVGSPEAPPQHVQAALQTLAQQIGVAIGQNRLLERERAMQARSADEQATLRRVASLVTGGAQPEEVFAAVAAEAGRLREADFAVMSRYAPDGTATVVGAWANGDGDPPLPRGTRVEEGGTSVHSLVFETRRPSRMDDYGDDQSQGAAIARQWGIRSAVGAPIHIAGRVWGTIGVASQGREPLPDDTEGWLAGFTELVATAIANAQAQMELRDYAEEQAALRRVATLVARAAAPEEVFDAVAAEICRVLDVDFAALSRYDPGGAAVVVGRWAKTGLARPFAVGTRLAPEGCNVHSLVRTSGRPVRMDDYDNASGPAADTIRQLGFHSAVGAPISVDGRLWGVTAVATARDERMPVGTEDRLTGFTDLVATALANAQAHAELTASLARIVAASDDTRRRVERDLHDGAQQRLVSLALQLRAAQSAAPAGARQLVEQLDGVADGLVGVMEDLLEIARGIHPGVLADGGLRPALKTLVRRSAIPVNLAVTVGGRLPVQTELAVYYAVAETLTNAAKHAHATAVDVRVSAGADTLFVRVSDDGRGGADISRGSGLEGLMDRVGALRGRMTLASPPGGGTTLDISLPLVSPG